jgi:hypothetical protein
MKHWAALVFAAATVLALAVIRGGKGGEINLQLWHSQVSPGPLSPAHAWLQTDCAACHTPFESAEPTKCIGCHANNTPLLQRQPTAFHATIGNCSSCHLEHQGASTRPTAMNHVALADIGLEVVRRNRENPTNRRLLAWMRQHERAAETRPTHPRVTSTEAALECATCHSTKDRHQKLFGQDCALCHGTGSWTIPEFRHPAPRSVQCVQCHQAPPSHYMMHFTMVSQRVAQQPDARVDQCFACHQTTSWNDIRGVGWYKHH